MLRLWWKGVSPGGFIVGSRHGEKPRCDTPAGTLTEVCSSDPGIKGESYLMGKAIQPLQSVKNYSNSHVHGHGRTWQGHSWLDIVFLNNFK